MDSLTLSTNGPTHRCQAEHLHRGHTCTLLQGNRELLQYLSDPLWDVHSILRFDCDFFHRYKRSEGNIKANYI